MRNDIPEFKAGDTLKVFVKIKEGEKFRIQLFEGVCIARKGSGISESFTVRKISTVIMRRISHMEQDGSLQEVEELT